MTFAASWILVLAGLFPWASFNAALSVAGIRVAEGRASLFLAAIGVAFSGWKILRPKSRLFALAGLAGAIATALLLIFAVRALFLSSTLRTAFGVTGDLAKRGSSLDYGWYLALIAALGMAVIGLLDRRSRRRVRNRASQPERERPTSSAPAPTSPSLPLSAAIASSPRPSITRG